MGPRVPVAPRPPPPLDVRARDVPVRARELVRRPRRAPAVVRPHEGLPEEAGRAVVDPRVSGVVPAPPSLLCVSTGLLVVHMCILQCVAKGAFLVPVPSRHQTCVME